jgi:lysophospholipase L1-like esterase
MRRGLLAIACMLLAPIAVASPAMAQSPVDRCLAAGQPLTDAAPLLRSFALLRSRGTLRIVAIGSSSTRGLWQTDPALTYPGMLKSELERLTPGLQVTVVNSGRNADTIPGNVARFARDVFAHAPDLVIWQIGTNDVTWLQSSDSLTGTIVAGIRQLQAAGADVVLMDQQYAPVILASNYAKMQDSIAEAARQANVPLFSRFDLMRRANEAGVPSTALTSWDGLHSSAAGYACTGRALARAIVAAMPAPQTQTAPARRQRRR